MKPRYSPLPKASLFVIALVFLALTMTCGSPTRLVSINLHEPEVNEMIQNSAKITSTDGWSFDIQNIEIKDGFIRINGDYFPLGNGIVSGSLDTVLKTEDGSLKGEIERVNFQGFASPDKQLKIVNDLFVQQINHKASEEKRQVEFESVEVNEGVVKIVLRFLP